MVVNRFRASVELFDFDAATGVISDQSEIFPMDDLLYGIEFSPNAAYLYIGGQYTLERYDLSNGALSNISVDQPALWSGDNIVRALQLGPDGIIYIAVRYRDHLGVINDPNTTGASIVVNSVFLDLGDQGRQSLFGLPNIFLIEEPRLDTLRFSACGNDSILYNGAYYYTEIQSLVDLTDPDGCDSLLPFTVGQCGPISFIFTVYRTCQREASIGVELLDISGGELPYSFSVNNGPFTDATKYDSLAEGSHSYFVMDQHCTYEVTAYDECGAVTLDINARAANDAATADVYIPNAFSPNGDNVNDQFLPFFSDDIEIIEYELVIFDRWGNMVFKSTLVGQSWNGNADGM